MFFSFLYDFALWLISIIYLPKILYDYFFRKKYQQSLSQRLGFNFPSINKGAQKLVWVHAVSMGETKAVSSLVKMIKKQLENPLIIISNVTETGHAEAKRCMPFADYHVYLPIDLHFVIRPIIKRVAPDLVILTESDFWYNFMQGARESGAAIALVNGKISERSFKRFQKVPFFTKKLFSCINKFCIQSKHYHERFLALGINENQMLVTGNLKFDDEYPRLTTEELEKWKKQLKIKPENQVVVVGSSHDPEERLILEQFKTVWQELPHVKLMIVPRHPERFHEVAALMEKENIPYMRFSQLDNESRPAKVILMDTMGLLRKCYQLADVAIVAGSYTARVGGHNILEPSWYGVPVVYGPCMHSQPELVELMQQYKAGEQVEMAHLGATVCELLKNSQKREELGSNGLRMLKDVNGATQRTWDFIKNLIQK